MLKSFSQIGQKTELAFGVFLFVLGAICAWNGWKYGVGQLNEIGPGAFPLGLGIVLMFLAGLAMREAPQSDPVRVKLGPVFMVTPGVVVWALLIEKAGLLVATAALVGFFTIAEERLNLKRAVVLALALTLVGYLVFILGFGVNFSLFGELL